MRVAVLGPLCKDENIVRGQSRFGIGGVTHYAGQALQSLGADVELFATFGDEPAATSANFTPLYSTTSPRQGPSRSSTSTRKTSMSVSSSPSSRTTPSGPMTSECWIATR